MQQGKVYSLVALVVNLLLLAGAGYSIYTHDGNQYPGFSLAWMIFYFSAVVVALKLHHRGIL